MELIVFMAVCTGSLLIIAGIHYLREKRWEKYNNQMHPQGVDE